MIEVATQLEAFIEAFGQPPDFVDGHQHVHLLPQVRDAVLKVVAETVPQAWVRQCGRSRGAMRLKDGKDLLLDVLSVGFRRKANQLGVLTNPAFAGAYDFTDKPGFAKVFPPPLPAPMTSLTSPVSPRCFRASWKDSPTAGW